MLHGSSVSMDQFLGWFKDSEGCGNVAAAAAATDSDCNDDDYRGCSPNPKPKLLLLLKHDYKQAVGFRGLGFTGFLSNL